MRKNGEGSIRKLQDGTYECVIQSKYINPDSKELLPKRIKRRGASEEEAIKKAKLELRRWEKEYERGHNSKLDKSKTFGQYMEEFIEGEVKSGVSASTYKSYIYTLRANFYNYKISKLQLGMLNQVEFELFFDRLVHDKSENTAKVPIQLCKRCCAWLYSRSLLEEDYASYAKTKRQIRDEYFHKEEKMERERKTHFSNEDIVKFYGAYKNNMSEYAPMILLILETMMRGQEALALTIDSIDFEANIIHIRSAVSERFIDNDKEKGLEKYVKVPKNKKERIVYMTPLARECVDYMIQQTKLRLKENPNNLLFPSYLKHGKYRTMDAFEMQFKVLCDKLGIDRDVRATKMPSGKVINVGLSVHALRHTAITIANTSPNSNVINTALAAGHAAIRTENIYTHSNIEALKNITTPSQAALKQQDASNKKVEVDEEEYQEYLLFKEWKEKFGEK